MDDLLLDTARRAIRYRNALPERSVAPTPQAIAALDRFREPLAQRGTSASDVIAMLDAIGSPGTVASAGGRYFGFVIGSSLPVTVAANWLATAWDQNAALAVMSPTAAVIEEVALAWLVDLFGLPDGTAGTFATGATMASFAALAAARHAKLREVAWDVDADGLFGAPPITVVLGEEAHASVGRALALLGLGRERVRTLAADAQGAIRADALPAAIEAPAIVCAQAGNVNSGASDPFDALRDWSDRAGAWLHVDGAFGLFAGASPSMRAQVRGVERADSWATDAHKWLNVPYDSGIAFVRDPEALRGAMATAASYLPTQPLREPFHFTPDFSRRARGVEIVAALRSLGRTGVAALVERCCRHARRFAEGLRAAGFEILNDVVLNQVVVALGDDATSARAIERIQREGVCWCGPTRWRGRAAMRISVSSWATRDADVERSLVSIVRCAAAASRTGEAA